MKFFSYQEYSISDKDASDLREINEKLDSDYSFSSEDYSFILSLFLLRFYQENYITPKVNFEIKINFNSIQLSSPSLIVEYFEDAINFDRLYFMVKFEDNFYLETVVSEDNEILSSIVKIKTDEEDIVFKKTLSLYSLTVEKNNKKLFVKSRGDFLVTESFEKGEVKTIIEKKNLDSFEPTYFSKEEFVFYVDKFFKNGFAEKWVEESSEDIAVVNRVVSFLSQQKAELEKGLMNSKVYELCCWSREFYEDLLEPAQLIE